MSKFKAGDKVVVSGVSYPYYAVGDVGVVVSYNTLGITYYIDFNSQSNNFVIGDGLWYVSDDNLKLYEEVKVKNCVYVMTSNNITVIDTKTGEELTIFKDDSRYNTAIKFVKEKTLDKIFELDTKSIIHKFINSYNYVLDDVTINIKDGVGVVVLHNFNNMEVPLHSVITDKILDMFAMNIDAKPLKNFINKLYANPSSTAIDELYLFIDKCGLPITEDGDFIAYKIVKENYMDIYTGEMLNAVGETLSMPRHLVNDNRNKTCAAGLHFCSKAYLDNYGSSRYETDRCMLVKINPADVVSIPSDYNNAKGRTWKYVVVGEVESSNWRETLSNKDFTVAPVVKTDLSVYEPDISEVKTKSQTPVSDSIKYSDAFRKGYEDGYLNARRKVPFSPRLSPVEPEANIGIYLKLGEYDNGYDAGYKTGRNKKGRIWFDKV